MEKVEKLLKHCVGWQSRMPIQPMLILSLLSLLLYGRIYAENIKNDIGVPPSTIGSSAGQWMVSRLPHNAELSLRYTRIIISDICLIYNKEGVFYGEVKQALR